MDFIMGADVSSLQAMEDHGAKYYDFDGKQKDALIILKNHGVNYIRLRIWNRPTTSFDEGDYCDFAHTLTMAKRIKKAGLHFLLDFHYSDSWADWKSQTIPADWEGQDADTLEGSVYRYTREVLEALYEENAYPDMVQIGNEIGKGILWDYGRLENINQFVRYLNAGICAVKEAETKECRAQIMLHVESGGDAGFFASVKHELLQFIASFTEDYDSIGDVYDEEEALEVWILADSTNINSTSGSGRDQATVIKDLVDNYFVTETGIPVNVKLVNKDVLLSATLSGQGPDVALNVAGVLIARSGT